MAQTVQMIVQPKEGWAHYVCPDCGFIRMLPSSEEEEDRPWCPHGSEYTWHAPHPENRDWTQMVYATVITKG